jgi:pimeloyl-ACP methyl ester carboxylesterase
MDELGSLRRRYADAHLDGPTWHEVSAVGARCEVLEAGQGPPLVLVHGGLGHCTQWVPLMRHLARDFRCYAVERPSNGASDEFPYATFAGDRRAHAVDMIGDSLDGLGLDRAPLVGNSLGGLFALGFATRWPQRVKHLVLMGAPAASDVPVPMPVRLMARPWGGRLVKLAMRRMRPGMLRRNEGMLLVAHAERLTDDYLAVGAATQRHNAESWPRSMRWMIQGDAIHPGMPATDWAREATAAGVSLTYVWGDQDRFVPVDHGRRIAQELGAPFVEIPDAGHLLWLDEPERAAQAVSDAIGNSSPDAPSSGPN